MFDTILFSSDVFDNKKVDADLESEYIAAQKAGFKTILFSYMSWFEDGKIKLNINPEETMNVIYRGWMMTADTYQLFCLALMEKRIHLINEAKEYENCHYFPNSYRAFGNDTARVLLFPLHQRIDVEEVGKHFTRFMVKDYVKSVKGSIFPKYFDLSIRQSEFDYWMDEFYKFRGDLISGGICIKEYLDLKKYEDSTNECRVFYFNHKVMFMEQDENKPSVPESMINKYNSLDSNFYTVDYAELSDGTWKVIECGDGQVSGILKENNVESFYSNLFRLTRE